MLKLESKPTILSESLEDDQTITENLSIFPVLELRAEESVWIAVQSDNEQPPSLSEGWRISKLGNS